MRYFRLLFVAFSLLCVLVDPPSRIAQSTDRARLQTEIESLRNQLKTREQEFLSPSAEDQARFGKYLAEPDTGLIRLLPRPEKDEQSKVSIRGGGAYYSFTRLTHEYGYGSDIELQRRHFHTGFAGADYGMLAMIGDMPLEAITRDTPSVQFLSSWDTPLKLSEARMRQRQSNEGIEQDGITYSYSAKAIVGKTYVLRSVNYDGSDVLVSFRVIREDDDGSLILLWNKMREFPTPKLARNK